MLIIGELINGMFKNVAKAIREKDSGIIRDIALKQVEAGAEALDVNCGPASGDPVSDMPWLVETVKDVTDAMIVIDSSNPKVIEAGLKACGNTAIINSTTADNEKMDVLIPLAKKYNAKLIALALSNKGVPRNKDERVALAADILQRCAGEDFSSSNIYLDPILMPVNISQPQLTDILETLKEFKILSDPPPNTVVGLSNISQGVKHRSIINRTFLVMALCHGLDAAIMDPLDTELMNALNTARLILNKDVYCESFLNARKKKTG
jgi:5-methyltetrahydrofolate corrinoid/iron sulfur protein methyltransferase